MEGSQALLSMDTKSPEVLNTSHGRDTLLFISPWAKLAVTPLLGKFWDDRTLRSYRPDAGPQCPVNGCSPRVTSIQPQLLDLNGQVMTERSCSSDQTQNPSVQSFLVRFQSRPDASGRSRSNAASASSRSPTFLCHLRHRTSA